MYYTHNVYLDCDQVFSDFVAGACAAVNVTYPGAFNWPKHWTYNFFEQAGTTREEVNEKCTVDFWANLPWTEDGKEILDILMKRFKPYEVMLLTKPMPNFESYTGKMMWVNKEIPALIDRVVPTVIPKEEFAFDFNCLLIDDSQENVERFIEAGGAAILVPRPWNKHDYIFYEGKAVEYIVEEVDRWIDTVNHPAKNRKERQHV